MNLFDVLAFLVLLTLAYLIGAIPFGLVVGKLFYGVDVREHGSGNVGTTNVFRVLGKRAGVVVLVCDMLKGYIPAVIAAHFFNPWAAIFIAAAPVVGHMYSVFLKGRGGKGVATGAAVVAALVPGAFLIVLVVWILLVLTTRYREPRVAGGVVPRPGAGDRVRPPAAVRDRRRARVDHRLVGAPRQHRPPGPRDGEPRQAPLVGRPVGARRRAGALTVRVTVVGSGSWGSAFSRLLVRGGHDVQVLTLTREEAGQLNATHENPHFLPGRRAAVGGAFRGDGRRATGGQRPDRLRGADAGRARGRAGGWLRAATRSRCSSRSPKATSSARSSGPRRSSRRRPARAAAALSGPNHAEEVSRDMPSATVVAAADEAMALALQQAITSDTFRVYTNDDVVGVEFCGAVKNPIAVAVGMSDGLGFGDNSRASLITRSIAEMTRLGMIQGAHIATFTGLAGIGDLIATCTSQHSRNRLAGELLAKGASPADVEREVGQVVEGIPTAYALHDLAGRLGIDMPVTENVYQVLEGRRTPQECVADLMGRAPAARSGTTTDAAGRLAQGRAAASVALKGVLGVW